MRKQDGASQVDVTKHDGFAIVRMAKKPVNSLNLEMIQAIDTSIQNAARPAPDRRASSLLRLASRGQYFLLRS